MYILTDKSVHARKCKDKINKIIKLNVEILFQKYKPKSISNTTIQKKLAKKSTAELSQPGLL